MFIHAGGTFEPAALDVVRARATRVVPDTDGFVRGSIIGSVELVDCVQGCDSDWADPGQWHWVLRRPRALRTPYQCPGKLGLWRPPEAMLERRR